MKKKYTNKLFSTENVKRKFYATFLCYFFLNALILTFLISCKKKTSPSVSEEIACSNENAQVCDWPLALDFDQDGIRNQEDNCPYIKNQTQEDRDEDEVGDTCDNCPGNPNKFQEDFDGDKSGDICDSDRDNDGILRGVDSCDFDPSPNPSDFDEDGIGDACDDDPDGDLLTNVTDNCETRTNPNQNDIDQDGIGDLCDEDADNDQREFSGNGLDPYPYCQNHELVLQVAQIGNRNSILEGNEIHAISTSPCAIEGDVQIVDSELEYFAFLKDTKEIFGNLIFRTNAQMARLDLQNLIKVHGSVEIMANPLLSSVEANSLIEIDGDILIANQNNLQMFSAPYLHSVGGNLQIQSNGNFFVSLNMNHLWRIGQSLRLKRNRGLQNVFFTELRTVEREIEIENNENLLSVIFKKLHHVGSDILFEGNTVLNAIEIAALISHDASLEFLENPNLDHLNLEQLSSLQGPLKLEQSNSCHIENINLRKLSHVQDLTILCPTLSRIELPRLSTVFGDVEIQKDIDPERISTSFIAPMLSLVRGNFFIRAAEWEFPELAFVYGDMRLLLMDNEHLIFPKLLRAGSLEIEESSAQLWAEFPSLLQVKRDIQIRQSRNLRSLLLPELRTVNGNMSIECGIDFEHFGFSSLHFVGKTFEISNCRRLDILSSSIEHVSDISIVENLNLVQINFNQLQTVTGAIRIQHNQDLHLIQMPVLMEIDKDLTITENDSLWVLRLPLLQSVSGFSDHSPDIYPNNDTISNPDYIIQITFDSWDIPRSIRYQKWQGTEEERASELNQFGSTFDNLEYVGTHKAVVIDQR